MRGASAPAFPDNRVQSLNRDFWFKFAPFLQWWPEVNRTSLRADAIAAITGAIVVLPQGVAFATIAGMPPEYGLYAAMIPAVIAALLVPYVWLRLTAWPLGQYAEQNAAQLRPLSVSVRR